MIRVRVRVRVRVRDDELLNDLCCSLHGVMVRAYQQTPCAGHIRLRVRVKACDRVGVKGLPGQHHAPVRVEVGCAFLCHGCGCRNRDGNLTGCRRRGRGRGRVRGLIALPCTGGGGPWLVDPLSPGDSRALRQGHSQGYGQGCG